MEPQPIIEPKKLSSIPYAILTILFIFSFGLSAFFYYQNLNLKQQIVTLTQQTSPPITTFIPPQKPTKSPIEDWKTYIDSQYAFQLKYPPDLDYQVISTMNHNHQYLLGFSKVNGDATAPYFITIMVEDNHSSVDEHLNSSFCDTQNCAKLATTTQLDNTPAKIISTETFPGSPQIRVIAMKNNLLYEIHVEPYNLPQYALVNSTENTFFQILSTFKFTNMKTIPTPSPENAIGCVVGGCSGTFCQDANSEPVMTTCEYKDEYACYRYAVCEKQPNGKCGWTKPPAYTQCLNNPSL